MSNIKKEYTSNLIWSFIEALFFQSILLMHQYVFFKNTTLSFYATTGAFFSIIYLCIKIIDLGFNKALISEYSENIKNKSLFLSFLKKQLFPNFFLYCILIFTLLSLKILGYLNNHSLSTSVTYSFILLLAAIIGIESLKSITKKVLQLSNHFRHIALFEITYIVCYRIIIWCYFYYTKDFTQFFIFGSYFGVTLLETVGLLYIAHRWYKRLPDNDDNTHYTFNLSYLKSRIFLYSNNMCKQIFSANMLVPFFAYSFSIEHAAFLKLASYIIHSINSMIEKIIDSTSSTLFAHSQHTAIKETFFLASRVTHHILICTFIFIIINFTKIITLSGSVHFIIPYIFIYFLIHYSENFFINIEKLYILHSRTELLLITTLGTTIVTAIVVWYALSPLSALILLFMSRIVSFACLTIFTFICWNIKPMYTLSYRYIIGSVVTSLLFFLFFKL